MKKEKEIPASFAFTPQTATVRGKCLVRMQKALNLGVEDPNRKRVPVVPI